MIIFIKFARKFIASRGVRQTTKIVGGKTRSYFLEIAEKGKEEV